MVLAGDRDLGTWSFAWLSSLGWAKREYEARGTHLQRWRMCKSLGRQNSVRHVTEGQGCLFLLSLCPKHFSALRLVHMR